MTIAAARRRARGAVAAGLVALMALTLGSPAGPAEGARTPADRKPARVAPVTTDPGRPNVVVILTDDQRRDSLGHMPNVQRLLVDQGTRYSNAMVPTSLCCPSRATLLTGRYAHTTRVYGNGDVGGARNGGWRQFYRQGMERRSLGVALRRAGYRTALIGKYLNFFGRHSPDGYVPPGWDEFSTFLSSHGRYYNYRLNDGTQHGEEPENYSTDVFANKAYDFIRTAPAEQPLFLFFAPYAPHLPYLPAPRHEGVLADELGSYTAPTINQPLDDLPRWMRKRAHFSKSSADAVRLLQAESLLAVDEAVEGIHDALVDTGRAQNTLYLYLSDNGYFWGEHRIIGKDSPYQDSTEIPMIARWDGRIAAGAVDDRIVLNVDVARTVARATGTQMRTEGLDMLGSARRRGFVLEAMYGYNNRPSYCGWRTKNRMYVRWATGEQELYDYRIDPHEKRNLAYKKAWRGVRKAMRKMAVERCSPVPPRFDWNRRFRPW